tara:strand:- start:2840 stop:3295 length:456 start_codon:yes stop_codon:yes gene_type:complete
VEGTPVFRVPETGLLTIPGASATTYADKDAVGVRFEIMVPRSGIVHTAIATDHAVSDIAIDLVCFTGQIAQATDDSAFAPTDVELNTYAMTIPYSTGDKALFSANSAATAKSLGILYVAPTERLWVQCVARGALVLAAATDLAVAILILPV